MKRYVVVKDEGIFEEINQEKCLFKNYISDEIRVLSQEYIIRNICSLDTINELLDRIEFILTIQAPSKNTYEEFYKEAMLKYDEVEWIKVIKTYYLREKMKKTFSFEKSYSDLARKYIYSEISILKGIPYYEVEQYITDYIHQNQ